MGENTICIPFDSKVCKLVKWCIFKTKAFYPFNEGLHNAVVIASFYKLFIFSIPNT